MDQNLRTKFRDAFLGLPHLADQPALIEEILEQLERHGHNEDDLPTLVRTFSRSNNGPQNEDVRDTYWYKGLTVRDLVDLMDMWGKTPQQEIGEILGMDDNARLKISRFGPEKLGLPRLASRNNDWSDPETITLFVLDYCHSNLSLEERCKKWGVGESFYLAKASKFGLRPRLKTNHKIRAGWASPEILNEIDKLREKDGESFTYIAQYLTRKLKRKINRNIVIGQHRRHIKQRYPEKYPNHPKNQNIEPE